MEWYAAFGLMVTLVWLYIEILRLLGQAVGSPVIEDRVFLTSGFPQILQSPP